MQRTTAETGTCEKETRTGEIEGVNHRKKGRDIKGIMQIILFSDKWLAVRGNYGATNKTS